MKKLNSEEITLLKLCLQRQKKPLKLYENINCLSTEKYNQLRDIVCDELISNGLAPDGNINEYGRRLEDLIDSLGRYIM